MQRSGPCFAATSMVATALCHATVRPMPQYAQQQPLLLLPATCCPFTGVVAVPGAMHGPGSWTRATGIARPLPGHNAPTHVAAITCTMQSPGPRPPATCIAAAACAMHWPGPQHACLPCNERCRSCMLHALPEPMLPSTRRCCCGRCSMCHGLAQRLLPAVGFALCYLCPAWAGLTLLGNMLRCGRFVWHALASHTLANKVRRCHCLTKRPHPSHRSCAMHWPGLRPPSASLADNTRTCTNTPMLRLVARVGLAT